MDNQMDDKTVKRKFKLPFLSRRRILLTVFLTGAALRAELFFSLLASPLLFFSRIPGLDMQTLLQKGEWGVSASPMFTAHRLMVAAFYTANGGVHRVEMIVLLQMLLGILTALMVSCCTLLLTRKRFAALAAGIIAAGYAPALLYECVTLQETVVTFTGFLSFFLFLWSRKHHFRSWYGAVCGFALGFASVGRPTALLWALGALIWSAVYCKRKRHPRRISGVFAGFVFILAFASCFNDWGGGYSGPFFRAEKYVLEVNTGGSAQNVSVPVGNRLLQTGCNALCRVPLLFSVREIPENINYYFLKERIFPLSLLPGPALLVPFALAGTFLALRRWRKKEGLVLGYVFALALPLCAIYPIGRYRLMLIPAFAILAVYPLIRRMGIKPYYGNAAALLLAAALNWNQFGTVLRSTDYLAWSIALREQAGEVTQESLEYCYEAFRLSGFPAAEIRRRR